jgi:nuclear GTP-binding protein
LGDLVKDAEERAEAFGQTQATGDDAGFASQQEKEVSRSYYKEFKKVIAAADILLCVLDARDPQGTRSAAVETMIREHNKQYVLVLNKIDLVPRDVVEGWLKVLRRDSPTVAFKASTQSQRSNLGQSSREAVGGTTTAECLGADALVSLLKKYSNRGGIKQLLTVGVIGFPNVGKSSLINSLKRAKVCQVGNTPGVTTSRQEISLDRHLKLLDCPGIVFSQARGVESVLRNCVKVEWLEDPITPVEAILQRCGLDRVCALYNVRAVANVNQFLVELARQRGRLGKGGVPHREAVARQVIQDWNQGKIPYYTRPPAAKPTGEVEIVSEFAKAFEVDKDLEAKDLLNISETADGAEVDAMIVEADMDVELESMSEDESEEEDDDEDAMSEDNDDMVDDDDEELSQQYELAPAPQAKKSTSVKRQQSIIPADEAALNPRKTRQLKTTKPAVMMEDDDVYDFAEHFTPDGNPFAALEDEDDEQEQ